MNLIICTSHLYIPITLTLISKSHGNNIVFTDKMSIKELISNLQFDISVIFDNNRIQSSKKNIFRVIHARKKHLLEEVNKYVISEVYFFHEGFSNSANWLMKFLAKNKDVNFHYIPVYRTFYFDNIDADYSLSSCKEILLNAFFWKYRVIMAKYSTSVYPIMTKSFFKKIRASEEYVSIEIPNVIDVLNNSLLPLDIYSYNSIVLLDNPMLKNKKERVDYEHLLYSLLADRKNDFPILFKNHPDRIEKNSFESQLKEIPAYISGNLITKRFRFFIGVNSSLLAESANDGAIAICITYLVNMDNEIQKKMQDYLETISNKVIFPRSKEKFWEIIENQ